MDSSSGPSLKGQRSVHQPDNETGPTSDVLGTSSQREAVSEFQERLVSMGARETCVWYLMRRSKDLIWSGSPLEWLKEPLAMGFTPQEVVDVLLSENRYSPWIPYEFSQRTMPQMDSDFHQASCVHQSVHAESKSIKSLTTEAKRMIAEHCGFGGLNPHESLDPECIGHVRFEDSTAYISYRNLETDELGEPQVAQQALERCRLALDRITGLCALLQKDGWLCNQIVVIRYDDGFRSTAIPFALIAQLQECVIEAISRHSLHPDPRNCRMFDTALQLLWMEPPPSISTGYRLENAVDLCALAVQMISVSLLSMCKAHVGPIHPFFLDRPITNICLSGIDGPLSREHNFGLQLGGLACLGLMLQAPIMTFTSKWPSAVQEDSREALETTAEHLLELWGPGCSASGVSITAQLVSVIEIGGGFIYRPLEGPALHWSPDPWATEDYMAQISDEQFDISGPLNIAGLFSINDRCPIRLQNEHVPIHLIDQEKHVLGTKKASWSLQQIQAGLQVGQIANPILNATWLKSASRTRKEQALARKGLAVLDQPLGLLVSFCTGIARRVPLREVVAEVFPHISSLPRQTFSGDDILEEMRESSFRAWFSLQPSRFQKTLTSQIMNVLDTLSWTGISPKSKLVTACSSDYQSDACVHISLHKFPLLATILQDTERSATFASLTTECVVTDQRKCQSASYPEWKNKVTGLATSVCQYRYVGEGDWQKLPNKSLENGRPYWLSHMNDKRRLVAEVSGNQGNEVILKVADGRALWSFYLRAYELVDRKRSQYIALREQSYVGEEDAQEVLIVSG